MRAVRSIWSAVALFVCVLALACTGCVSYNNPGEGECGCGEPPGPQCVDATTRRVFSAGACVEDECVYPSTDEECTEGACVDGECTACQPDCGVRTCGPEPVCGGVCGLCTGCDGEPDESLCDPGGFCMQVCCPDCSGRECGPDGCGGTCGACPEDEQCGYDGQCQPECFVPQYPFDCAEVPYFQCGIEPRCEGGVIAVDWHEHIFCDGEEQIVPFYCEHACPMGCAEGFIPDWPESGQQLVDEYCFGTCDQILVDNGGDTPVGYPPTWAGVQEAQQRYQDALADFQSTYQIDADAYRFSTHPLTFTPEITRVGGAYALVVDPGLTEDGLQPAADAFFEQWGALFAIAGITKEPGRVTCSGSWCRATQQQTYCGLAIEADDPAYDGALRLRVDLDTGGLLDAYSATIPMIPIPVVPHLSEDEVRTSLLGLVLEYWCADGPHTVEVTEAATFTFEDDPVVFARAGQGDMEMLEIRTAYRLQVAPVNFFSWTLIVDAFDGSLLETAPDFICD